MKASRPIMANPKVVIKKYENRRLYDTAASRYVNLEDVAQMVRDGVDVQVVDASSGEDLTRVVLTQIIMDNAKGRDSALPLDILRQMVMSTGAASQEAMLKYMRASLEMYQNAYRAFIPPATPLDYMRKMMGNPPSTAGQSREGSESEVEDLRRRIEELEKIVADARASRNSKKKAGKER
jgi:polyhydroxyalkanoate synthesis repressor PhaR